MPELCELGKKKRLRLLLAGKDVLVVDPSQQGGCVSVSVDGGTAVPCTMRQRKGRRSTRERSPLPLGMRLLSRAELTLFQQALADAL